MVAAGIVAGQLLLFGPSFVGRSLLLPLDVLALPGFYLPQTPQTTAIEVREPLRSDPILTFEPWRRFAAAEVRAGRLPLWNPHAFAGVPEVRWGKYGPFAWPSYLWPSARTLAWTQLLVALAAGLGAYGFFRRVLGSSFWPAAAGAWCYPLTGYFVLWQGYPTSHVAAWLPAVLWATDATLARPLSRAGAALALVTAAAALSGQVDIAAQVLLAAGAWALVKLLEGAWDRRSPRRLLAAAAGTGAGWLLGLALAAPYLLPLVDYARQGARTAARASGVEERPPVGLSALPQVVLPEIYGASRHDSFRLAGDNRLESSAAAYAGLVATLLLAPLAAASRRHRRHALRLLLLVILGLAWTLNLPGLVALLRLPGLDLLSHNRFVFAAGFALLALAVIGLERLHRGPLPRRWLAVPALALLLTGGFAWYRSVVPPPLLDAVEERLRAGARVRNVGDLEALAEVRRSFRRHHAAAAATAVLALGLLALLPRRRRAVAPALAVLLLGELLWHARTTNPQAPPELDYPPLPVLDALAGRPGRILGVGCLPPNLAMISGLSDVRGYDAVDPTRYLELLSLAADPRSPRPSYARSMWLTPQAGFLDADGLRLHPVLDLLGVRWLIFRHTPPPSITPAIRAPDYWVMENTRALPRAFVPARVEPVVDRRERLGRLADADFDPRRLALVETRIDLPAGDARGTATLVAEVPNRLELALAMATPGLVVVADRWDAGWRARLDGRPVPVLRVDHALRGVVAPAGEHRLVFTYRPAGLIWGIGAAIAAAIAAAGWLYAARRRPAPQI
ncbi:MAG: hypothetical protein D6696_13700 [Acidobacteria bacterium]|nr:MAG: hypothetical protein D6696_13700 [Acidobacteriota bacterium]